MKILEMRDIYKSFDGEAVLKGISMDVSAGEKVSIIGPSGSGKSTFLRCATFLEKIDMGEILYKGMPCAKMINNEAVYIPNKELNHMRSCFGLVFQNFNLFPHYNVMKNITDAPINVQKRDKEEVYENAHRLLKKMGLEDKEKAYPYQLSGGQQQRVSIVRALAMNPDILFFDEPTSALDPELTAEVLKVIRQLADEQITMVIVTHEMSFARMVSDRVIFIDGGTIIEEGIPDDVILNPANERTRSFLNRLNEN